jgi:hypothetical protein
MAGTLGKKVVEWLILTVPALILPFAFSNVPRFLTLPVHVGYNRAESLADYKSSEEFIFMLVDIVSRGGNLLLNIGPAGAGLWQQLS